VSSVQPGLVSPVFVGRGEELAALLAALESAAAGEPAVVVVGGEAGVG
jgi:predicted ATPase